MRLSPARHFRGRFSLPGDKSISHRLAILGALATGETHVANFSSGADCASTLRCLEGLGVAIERSGHAVVIHGEGPERLTAPNRRLDAGNSGSTLRMLAGAVAARPFTTTLTGDASLRRRPVERVAVPLRAMGAVVETSGGHPPLSVHGGPLRGVTWDMDVASAQVKTAILLAGLQAEGVTTVREPDPSRDHTERLMPLFGAALERNGPHTSIRGGARLRSVQTAVPGDVSSAAFLVVAALTLPDSSVELDGVLLNPHRTAFLDVLRQMGGDVEIAIQVHEPEPVGRILARTSRLRGMEVPPALVPSLIDEVPALAIAASRAEGRFSMSAAKELRVKESDRIAALVEGLRAMGARIEEREDGFEIDGGPPLHGARVRSFDDHRIAMAFAIAALGATSDSVVEDGECASVSFPEFWQLLEAGCA